MKNEQNKPISQIILDRRLDQGDIPDLIGRDKCLRFNIFSPKFKIGLQPPDGIAVSIWIQIICTLIAVRGGLISSAHCLTNMMRNVVGFLNKNRAGLPPIVPDFRLLKEIALHVPLTLWARKPDYLNTLIQLLEVIADNCPMFETFSGIDLERDVVSKGKSCVIEIPTIYPSWLRLFIIDLMLARLLYGRIHRRHKVDTTEIIIYIDEADQDVSFLSSDAVYADGYSILAQLLRMGREYGIMVVIGVGTLGQMSKFVSSSFQYKFNFNISEGDQILYAKRNILLPHGAEQMLPALDPGECIVQQSQLGWSHPMACTVDYFPSDRKTNVTEYDSHPFIPSKHLDQLPELQKDVDELIRQHKNRNQSSSQQAKPKESGYCRKLLDLAIRYPFKPSVKLWKEIGKVRPDIQSKTRNELENNKLAEYATARISSRPLLLIRPTEAGYKLLGQKYPEHRGHGAIEHAHYCAWVCMAGNAQGYKAKTEVLVQGTTHLVDVMWQVKNELFAFECISRCEQNIISHLEACFIKSKDISTVTIVATKKGVLESVRKNVRQEFSLAPFDHRIRYELVEKYLEACWK